MLAHLKNWERWGKNENVEEKLRKLRKKWESWGKTEKVEENWESWGKREKVEEKLRKLRKNWKSWGKTEKVEENWESWGKTEKVEEKLRKLRKNWESWGKNWESWGKTEKAEEKVRKLRKNWENWESVIYLRTDQQTNRHTWIGARDACSSKKRRVEIHTNLLGKKPYGYSLTENRRQAFALCVSTSLIPVWKQTFKLSWSRKHEDGSRLYKYIEISPF